MRKDSTLAISLAAIIAAAPVAASSDGGGSSATSAEPPSATEGAEEIPWVRAIAIDTGVVPGSGEVSEDRLPDLVAGPEIEPVMPLPVGPNAKTGDTWLGERSVVSYDLRTGEESRAKEGELPLGGAAPPSIDGSRGAAALLSWQEEPATGPLARNFTALAPVANPGLYPFSANVRLLLDTDGDGTFDGLCSGALIDPMHVITAGHCLYGQGHSGWWGWIGGAAAAPAFGAGTSPWGSARAVQIHAWSGWTDGASWDHDLGVVDLDRPVGALSGWLGYRPRDSCGYYTDNSDWRKVGYPGEAPFDGQTQHTQTGSFDDCDTFLGLWHGNNVRFNRGSFGGFSGSASHRPQGACPSCQVSGVLSATSVDGSHSLDALIDSGKHADINSIIATDTPSTFDLVPMAVQTNAARVAGGTLSSLSYLVHNYSSASWSGTGIVDVWLSTDDDITTFDTYLQRHVFTATIAAKDSTWVSVDVPPQIPSDTPTGGYWVGVIISGSSDPTTHNNDTDGADAAPIAITGGPDLVIASIHATDAAPPPLQPFDVNALVTNIGSVTAGPTNMDLYREYQWQQVTSIGTLTFRIADIVATEPVPALPADDGFTATSTVDVPTRGSHRFRGCTNSVPGELPWDNNCSFWTEVDGGGCSGPRIVLLSSLVISDTRTYSACHGLSAGGLSVLPTADLTLEAGEHVTLKNGLTVEQDGKLTVDLD